MGNNNQFDKTAFWALIKEGFKKIGDEAVFQALTAFYVAQSECTPAWARATLYGALAYLVLPLDAVPDALLGVGFGDDTAVILAALAAVGVNVTPELVGRARAKADAILKKRR